MMRRTWPLLVFGVAMLVAAPGIARANAGVPMLAVMWPGMGLALIPVIALETFLVRRDLGTELKRTAGAVTVANVASTLVGVPVAWVLMFGVEYAAMSAAGGVSPAGFSEAASKAFAATLGAAWLVPYEADLWWMAPVAALMLLVPFFFASWWSEYGVARLMLRDVAKKDLWRGMRGANLASYAMLALVPIGFLVAGAFQNLAK